MNYWTSVIGKKLASMTQVISFENKTLFILVKSSTLYSVLNLHEKTKLLKNMQKKFSQDIIRNIIFKMG